MQLHQLLEHQAEKNPGATAIVGGTARMSYGELDSMANVVAAHLRRSGVCRGDRVALWLEKSPSCVAALFGILKTGACYIPIDPKAPVRRAVALLDVTKPSALIASAANIEALRIVEAELPRSCLTLGNDGSFEPAYMPARSMSANERVSHSEDPLAYILFTSGSTGSPKGVMISHAAAMSFVRWAAEYFKLSAMDVVSSHAPLHFDLSIFDIFASVMAGATIALVPARESLFPASLGRWISASRITVWYSVPSALIHLVDHGGLSADAFADMRLVLFAGEVLPPRYLRPLMALATNASLYNLYGPTETNVCTVHRVEKDPSNSAPIPIGRACENCRLVALDERLEPVEQGKVGELYVGGSSLMEGYWQRPEETGQRMIADPREPGRKLYKTGDMVRLDDAGLYHFLGRRDLQIKLQGYRIEPAEIEATLGRHPSVKMSAVLAGAGRQGHRELVAFVVGADGAKPDRNILIEHCAGHLPPHMIPRRFVFLEEFLLTSTGKLDRSALEKSLSQIEMDGNRTDAR